MVDFSKFQKQPGSILPTEEQGASTSGSIPPDITGKSKGKQDRQNKLADKFADIEARLITLEIALSMQAPKTITNDALWTAIKENAHLAGVRNLIDYIARRNTKNMPEEEVLQLEDKRGGLTAALAKIMNKLWRNDASD